MSTKTTIPWCHHTFNPWRGYCKVGAGCANCYAERLAKRNPKVFGTWGPKGKRVIASESYWHLPLRWNRAAEKAGERRRVFCGSMMDVFENRGDLDLARSRLFGLINQTPRLDWLLLTKRPAEILDVITRVAHEKNDAVAAFWRYSQPAQNLWLGYSASTQADLDEGLARLLASLPTMHFLSLEPLLEPIDLSYQPDGIDWLIVGGESGSKSRLCHSEWIRSIVLQCRDAGIPCYVKQDSGPRPGQQGRIPDDLWSVKEFPDPNVVRT